MLIGMNHVGLTVRDLQRSLAFYCDLLGFELLGAQERSEPDLGRIVGYPEACVRMAFLRLPRGAGPVLELMEFVRPTGLPVDPQTCNPGVAHLAFTVSDVRQVYETLSKRGVRFLSAPVEITAGENQGALSTYLLDPDAVRIALFQPAPGRDHGREASAQKGKERGSGERVQQRDARLSEEHVGGGAGWCGQGGPDGYPDAPDGATVV